jgi:hypothetical protein
MTVVATFNGLAVENSEVLRSSEVLRGTGIALPSVASLLAKGAPEGVLP